MYGLNLFDKKSPEYKKAVTLAKACQEAKPPSSKAWMAEYIKQGGDVTVARIAHKILNI